MAPPTAAELIAEAIRSLHVKGSSKGVSRAAIKGYIGDRKTSTQINISLKNGEKTKKFIKVGDSFKLPAAAVKPKKTTAAKPKKTTAAKPKKTTAAKPKKTTAAKPKKAASKSKATTDAAAPAEKPKSTKPKAAKAAKPKSTKPKAAKTAKPKATKPKAAKTTKAKAPKAPAAAAAN